MRQTRDIWQRALPYSKYVFLNLLTEIGGGLEHRNSVCMMTSRWATRTRRGYLSWLDLVVSHEYFHVWNVKRLRPVELGPFDYETENPTRSLWVAEGITDYYAPLILRRAGLSETKEYLGTETPPAPASLSTVIATLQSTPGRLLQSAEQSSFDAWIKLYRPDENSANTTISYYTKGAVAAWLLDARIRRSTDGAKSLDDLMRLALGKFSGETGFTTAEFKALAETVAGVPLAEFFRHTVESTDELDYTEALDWFGLGFKHEKPAAASLGVDTKIDNGRLSIKSISSQSPASDSGLSVDDEIIAIDDFRVRPDQLTQRLENYKPGDRVTILVSRRDQLIRIPLEICEEPAKWQVEIRPDASERQKGNTRELAVSSRAKINPGP